jgi:hypothetical protein
MKKIVLFVVSILLCSVSVLYADLDYSFDLISFSPLHKEYFADRARPDLSISYLYYQEGYPDRILQDGWNRATRENRVNVWNFTEDVLPVDKMVLLKIGETAAIARSTFTFDHWLSPISFDLTMQGILQEFFTGLFTDNFGYDGIFFTGINVRVGDVVSMRVGDFHYCSHYGDSIMKVVQYAEDPSFDDFWITYKYVRMDGFVIGLSIDPNPYLRVYGELNYPPRDIVSIRPDMFAPNWVEKEGARVNPDYPDSYNARIVNFGFEMNYPLIKQMGNTTLGYDLHLYEEGKVQYDKVLGGDIYFNEEAPWEREHNVRLAQELNDEISFEVTYHNGRSPFNNLYFQHTSYVSFTVRYNPESTITLFDTKKSRLGA